MIILQILFIPYFLYLRGYHAQTSNSPSAPNGLPPTAAVPPPFSAIIPAIISQNTPANINTIPSSSALTPPAATAPTQNAAAPRPVTSAPLQKPVQPVPQITPQTAAAPAPQLSTQSPPVSAPPIAANNAIQSPQQSPIPTVLQTAAPQANISSGPSTIRETEASTPQQSSSLTPPVESTTSTPPVNTTIPVMQPEVPTYRNGSDNPWRLLVLYGLDYDDRRGNFGARLVLKTFGNTDIPQPWTIFLQFPTTGQRIIEGDMRGKVGKVVSSATSTSTRTWWALQSGQSLHIPSGDSPGLSYMIRGTYDPVMGNPAPTQVLWQVGADKQRALLQVTPITFGLGVSTEPSYEFMTLFPNLTRQEMNAKENYIIVTVICAMTTIGVLVVMIGMYLKYKANKIDPSQRRDSQDV